MSGVPVEIFEQYGDDAAGALAAMANTHPAVWSTFVDTAAEALYSARYRQWVRSHVVTTPVTNGQEQLFDAATMKSLTIRERVVLVIDGERCEFLTAELAGEAGAEILDRVAKRDARPARTTIKRSRDMHKLAQAVRAASAAEGRPVTVAEVLERAA